VQLAACYRIFSMLGWTEMIYNHITVRVADSVTGGQKQFLINPFGLHYRRGHRQQPAEDRPRRPGNVWTARPWPVNPAGFTCTATIHDGHRRCAHCVMHTHTTAGWPWPAAQGGPGAEQLLRSAAARPGGVPRL
jgi:ribulose-5-phosphate 4-epimerase/fuculose-1-phosphate aldolase